MANWVLSPANIEYGMESPTKLSQNWSTQNQKLKTKHRCNRGVRKLLPGEVYIFDKRNTESAI